MLHAWWPAGMIIGGLLAYALTGVGAPWQVKLSLIVLPAVVVSSRWRSPSCTRSSERVASNITTGDMWKEAGKPLFLLLFVCMWMTAAVELGPDQWFPSVMSSLTGLEGILFLVYTAGLMFVIRTYFADIAHTVAHRNALSSARYSPPSVSTGLAACSQAPARSRRSPRRPSLESARCTCGRRCSASPVSCFQEAARCCSA